MSKTIVLTGASSGIGRATAELLARAGHRLLLVARRENLLNDLAATLPDAVAYPCDMMNIRQVEATAERIVAEQGRIDVLINNAGVGFPTALDTLTTADYERMMDTNVKGLVLLTRPILAAMKAAGGGHIINVGSGAGVSANPVAPIYCASKFALEGYTDGLRQQLSRDKANIRVTMVRPGAVDSEYWGDRDVPRDKFMTCEEMAAVFQFVIDFPAGANVREIFLESVR